MERKSVGKKLIWGDRYPEVVPNSPWAAWTCHSNGVPSSTDIYFFCDDPLFEFRTVENSPWLTKAQCEIINDPHRKKFFKKEARTFAPDASAELARDKAFVLELREPIFKAAWENHNDLFDTELGGWMPITMTYADRGIASELAERNKARRDKDHTASDLIRRIITSGGVEVGDRPNGTFWFFPISGYNHV